MQDNNEREQLCLRTLLFMQAEGLAKALSGSNNYSIHIYTYINCLGKKVYLL